MAPRPRSTSRRALMTALGAAYVAVLVAAGAGASLRDVPPAQPLQTVAAR